MRVVSSFKLTEKSYILKQIQNSKLIYFIQNFESVGVIVHNYNNTEYKIDLDIVYFYSWWMCKIKLFWEKMFNYLMYKKSRRQVLSSLVSLGYTGYDVQKLCNYMIDYKYT